MPNSALSSNSEFDQAGPRPSEWTVYGVVNSLFEDNAEFGMGMRLAIDKQNDYAKELVQRLASAIGDQLAVEILSADQSTEEGIFAQRGRVKALKEKIASDKSPAARDLLAVADMLVKKSVWII